MQPTHKDSEERMFEQNFQDYIPEYPFQMISFEDSLSAAPVMNPYNKTSYFDDFFSLFNNTHTAGTITAGSNVTNNHTNPNKEVDCQKFNQLVRRMSNLHPETYHSIVPRGNPSVDFGLYNFHEFQIGNFFHDIFTQWIPYGIMLSDDFNRPHSIMTTPPLMNTGSGTSDGSMENIDIFSTGNSGVSVEQAVESFMQSIPVDYSNYQSNFANNHFQTNSVTSYSPVTVYYHPEQQQYRQHQQENIPCTLPNLLDVFDSSCPPVPAIELFPAKPVIKLVGPQSPVFNNVTPISAVQLQNSKKIQPHKSTSLPLSHRSVANTTTNTKISSTPIRTTACKNPNNHNRSRNICMNSSVVAGNLSSTRLANDSVRRSNHNSLERRRREDLRGLLNKLRMMVPGLTGSDRSSKVIVLDKSKKYLDDLQTRHRNLVEELKYSRLRTMSLIRKLNKALGRSD